MAVVCVHVCAVVRARTVSGMAGKRQVTDPVGWPWAENWDGKNSD